MSKNQNKFIQSFFNNIKNINNWENEILKYNNSQYKEYFSDFFQIQKSNYLVHLTTHSNAIHKYLIKMNILSQYKIKKINNKDIFDILFII